MATSRREFLQSTAATSAALAVGAASTRVAHAFTGSSVPGSSLPAAQRQDPPAGNLPFLHGVASGDPLPDTVVLWTRVTPSPEATPGSCVGEDVRLTWEVALDEAVTTVVAKGDTVATKDHDHTVHVDPWNLEPDTVYFYRFTVADGPYAGAVSPVGRTKTAPAYDTQLESLKFAVASCANWESGHFTAYRDIAQRGLAGELDFTLFLGDYIYEYGAGEYSGFGPVRDMQPAHETISLEDYRIRYGLYHTDQYLQQAHAALPWITVWDDHETANDSWSGGAENHDPATEGDWTTRRDAAMQAYFEWLPVRATNPSNGGHIYRSFTFGDLADLTVMDLRTYRDESTSVIDYRGINSPDRTMLGSEQLQWLRGKIETNTATWTILGNSVMFAPLNLVTLNQNPDLTAVSSFLSEHRIEGIPVNTDQWDGYAAERREVSKILAASSSKTLVCTGDIHSEWAHELSVDGQTFGAELVSASISAPNVNEALKLPEGNPVSVAAENILAHTNPHLRHVQLDSHGYAIACIDRSGVDMTWLRVDNILAVPEQASVNVAHTWRWEK